MSDVKISALPAATSIANTDVAPVVTGGVTKKASATVITSSALAASVAGTNPVLIGPATSANATRFPNALSITSSTAAGIQKNESHNIGLIAEGTADAADTSIYGVGLYGVGYTASGTRCGGVIGEGHVSATGDTGSAIGVRGYANDTHAGGLNIGLYGNASGGSSNYALYMAGGDILSTTAQTWTLGGDLTLSGGTLALSSGTANGVLYLNGSKAVTSGSGLVFDGSNLGLGVTPSGWNNTYFKSMEIGRVGQGISGAISSLTSSPSTWISNNSYATYSAGIIWNYAISRPAAQYKLEDGLHKWFTAPSGTAGSAISFTQAMTLDASGNLHVPGGGGISTNEAFGTGALKSNTTGDYNTASGRDALLNNTTGYNNTANGVNALVYNTTGYSNTASGFRALLNNTTGHSNTANGVNALYSNTTGSANIAVGFQALLSNTTGSGNTAISPLNSAGTYAPVFNPTTENDRFCMGSTGVTNAYIQVAWTVVSDARDKTDFAPVPHGLDFVTKLKPTAYRYKIDRDATDGHGPVRYGFKAQEVLALEGDTPVVVDAEDADKLRFNDQSLIAVLVNAIQELKAELDQLKAKVK